jgi:Flp pilus assembly protein TadD
VTETYHLFQKGRRQLAEGLAAQATVSLEKAKRREPRKASIREALGIAYFRLQRYAEAESEFRALLEIAPSDDYGHYALGRTLDKLGRRDEAQTQYKLARALKPTSEQYRARVQGSSSRPGREED